MPARQQIYPLAAFFLLALRAPGAADVIGNPFLIPGSGCRFPDAACSSQDQSYLVVWADYNAASRGIFARRVTNDGAPAQAPSDSTAVPELSMLPL